MTFSQVKLIIEEKIKTHERAIEGLPWSYDKEKVKAKIGAFKEVLEIIEGPNGHNT